MEQLAFFPDNAPNEEYKLIQKKVAKELFSYRVLKVRYPETRKNAQIKTSPYFLNYVILRKSMITNTFRLNGHWNMR